MGWNCSRGLAPELILVEERTGLACLGICNDRENRPDRDGGWLLPCPALQEPLSQKPFSSE